MDSKIIVSISQYVKMPEISDIIENRRFDFIPAIEYYKENEKGEKIEGPTPYSFPKPFSLWELSLPLELLCSYLKEELRRKEEFTEAGKVYLKLKAYASRCAERVIADYVVALVLKSLNSEIPHVFYIEGPPSNKIIARLSYLYLDLKNITISFISYKPEDMITSVMSFQSDRFQADLYHLLDEINVISGPYPGSSQESLVQTYFYKHVPIERGTRTIVPYPLRIDIFSQGLSESEFEEKRAAIMAEADNWRTPYQIGEKYTIQTILPDGLVAALNSWKSGETKSLDFKLKEYFKELKRWVAL